MDEERRQSRDRFSLHGRDLDVSQVLGTDRRLNHHSLLPAGCYASDSVKPDKLLNLPVPQLSSSVKWAVVRIKEGNEHESPQHCL